MSIQTVGLKAYNAALKNFSAAQKQVNSLALPAEAPKVNEFSDVLRDSLKKVNDLQAERSRMITSFAAGENQNVHELMISLQKASLAVNMTAAVRNKVIEAYRELTRMQF
ncbi:MAG: flagellar hook-basal body complex protein FliE [Desulfovibrio sp.]|jgi:flagellar hook-basal body complex protein FliE|nr:flagellar hook-basal body complex protein FliE [Desulfovibrio sp.]